MTGEICGDNRFEIIKKAKEKLIESTNIETSPDEMAVLDAILFRMWQMRWLPGCKEWIKTSERLPEAHRKVLVWNEHKYAAVAYVDFSCPVWHTTVNVWGIDEFPYWMPLPEPPEEVEE